MPRVQPRGLRYATFRLADGVSFVHVACVETDDGSNPLSGLPSFKEFQHEIGARCDIAPDPQEATIVGSYRFFAG